LLESRINFRKLKNPLISVIICTYNRAELLQQTLSSVLEQRYQPVEIIVFDDGSSDETPNLVTKFGNKIRYSRQSNQGIAAARTNACRMAEGEFIAFQDDDDLMPPDRIIALYEAFCTYPSAVLAVGNWAYMDAKGVLTGKQSRSKIYSASGEPTLINDGYKAILFPELTAVPHATLFRKRDGERIGWFDSERFFHACSDTDFFARLGALGPILYVPQIVSYYRTGHPSIWDKEFLSEYSRFLLFEKHLQLLNTGDVELRERLQKRMLSTLNRLIKFKSKSINVPSSVSTDFIIKGFKLLGIKEKLSLLWSAYIKRNIRKLIIADS